MRLTSIDPLFLFVQSCVKNMTELTKDVMSDERVLLVIAFGVKEVDRENEPPVEVRELSRRFHHPFLQKGALVATQ